MRGQVSTYKRGGVANLFAALNMATGHVLVETTQTKMRVDFLKFMDKVVVSQPADTSIHVVKDNLRAHQRNVSLHAHRRELAQPSRNLV